MESNEIALCLATACEFFNTQRSYEMKMQVVLETGSSEVVLPLLNALLHSMRVLFFCTIYQFYKCSEINQSYFSCIC